MPAEPERSAPELEARLQALLDASLDAIVMMDAEGHITEFNLAAEKTFGWSRRDALGKVLADLIIPERFRQAHRDGINGYLATGAGNIIGKRVEVAALRADGSEFPAEVTVVEHRGEGPRTFTGYVRDITDRVRASEALRSSEARFRRLTESGLMGITVLDAKGLTIEANDAALTMLGYTRDDLAAGMLTPERLRTSEHERASGHVRQQLAEKGVARPWEAEFMRKDGSPIPLLVGVAALDRSSLICVMLDLTEKRKSDAAVRELRAQHASDSKFRGLLESAPDAMVIADAHGTIVLVNAQLERLFGYSRDELLGKNVDLLVPDRLRPGHPEHRAAYLKDPKPRAMASDRELLGRRKDGAEIPVEISLSPIETDEGLWVASAIRDVSARKKVENALRLANRELETFSYSVAHDLRTPLRGINGFAQVLVDDYADKLDPEGVDCLLRIRTQALQMGDLIDALLALARVSRSELVPVPVDVSALARTTIAELSSLHPDRKVEVSIEEGLNVPMDRALARTLVDNLVGNAWKFTAKQASPRIEVGRVADTDVPAFFVRDNGAGFDEAHARKMFLPFQRLHSNRHFPGMGIGLATARRIVDRHGGRIWAEGEVDVGATFFVAIGEIDTEAE